MSATSVKSEEAVKAIMTAFADAWNVHDAKPLAALFVEDADFVNVMGMWWKGRDEIERNHAGLFSTLMRESRLTLDDTQVRFLKLDAAVAHSTWELVGQQTPDGEELPPRKGVISSVMMRQNDKWEIVSAHNTDTVQLTDFKPFNK
jgi:uncharacterized protein (TIGR02246 family)